MRVDEPPIRHSTLANPANQILVCFYWLKVEGEMGGWLGFSFHSRQTLSTNSFVGFKSITASTFQNCLLLIFLTLFTVSFFITPSLLPSSDIPQGRSKMTRNVTRQDKFFPSGHHATRFKLETLIFERNATHLDGLPASLSKTHSYCDTSTDILGDGMACWNLYRRRQPYT